MISERLKDLRNRQGLTQVELARKIGITKDLYNKYERTDIRPPYETICKLADVLSTTTDYILERTDNPMPVSDESDKASHTDNYQNIVSENSETSSLISHLNTIMNRVTEMRLKAGLSREELAEKSGVSFDVISNLEDGKGGISGDNVLMLSKALNTNFDYLMGLSNNNAPPKKGLLEQLAENPPASQPVAYIFGSGGGRKVITDKNKLDAINAFVELLDKNDLTQK